MSEQVDEFDLLMFDDNSIDLGDIIFSTSSSLSSLSSSWSSTSSPLRRLDIEDEDDRISLSSLDENDSINTSLSSRNESDNDDIDYALLSDEEMEYELMLGSSAFEERPKKRKRCCIKGYIETVVPNYSEDEFITHFRVSRAIANNLVEQYTGSIYYNPSMRDLIDALVTPSKDIHTFLWFVGHQVSSYRDVADRFDLSLSALYDLITRVAQFLGSLAEDVVKWPNERDSARTKAFYLNERGFPGVVGSLDGTHIRIDRPTRFAESYYNRKGFHSIQMQVVCNEEYKILDFMVGYAGSVHDARVFCNSPLYQRLSNANMEGYILADSAYPCLKNVLTPYKDNGLLRRAEKNFNAKFRSCRIHVENTIGMLKQRFPFLYYCRLRNHKRRLLVMRACVVLYNISGKYKLNWLREPEENEDLFEIYAAQRNAGNVVRNTVRDWLYRPNY